MYPRIKNLREDNDLNKKTIAEMINISQTTYPRYENGSLNIPNESLIQLAKFYKTSIDYLLGLTDKKTLYTIRLLNNHFYHD